MLKDVAITPEELHRVLILMALAESPVRAWTPEGIRARTVRTVPSHVVLELLARLTSSYRVVSFVLGGQRVYHVNDAGIAQAWHEINELTRRWPAFPGTVEQLIGLSVSRVAREQQEGGPSGRATCTSRGRHASA